MLGSSCEDVNIAGGARSAIVSGLSSLRKGCGFFGFSSRNAKAFGGADSKKVRHSSERAEVFLADCMRWSSGTEGGWFGPFQMHFGVSVNGCRAMWD
mmetsp:Transcript_55048/g.120101  ORF Transcript_55048/g.120101 Transcript_55048/m.120101 type:complete len:97 (+) Transcript_55048:1321-1611(+)